MVDKNKETKKDRSNYFMADVRDFVFHGKEEEE